MHAEKEHHVERKAEIRILKLQASTQVAGSLPETRAESWPRLSHTALRRNQHHPLQSQISSLHNSETVSVYEFRHPACGTLSWQS